MAMSALKVFRETVNNGYDFDLIDAHYFYPDGVAAAKIAEKLGKPFVITARGTDVNLIPKYKKPRQMILAAAAKASAIITVCKALKETLVELGIDRNKIKDIRLISKDEGKEQKAADIKEKKGFPTISILHTGGTIASKVDYNTGGVVAKYTPEELISKFPELLDVGLKSAFSIVNFLSSNS